MTLKKYHAWGRLELKRIIRHLIMAKYNSLIVYFVVDLLNVHDLHSKGVVPLQVTYTTVLFSPIRIQ